MPINWKLRPLDLLQWFQLKKPTAIFTFMIQCMILRPKLSDYFNRPLWSVTVASYVLHCMHEDIEAHFCSSNYTSRAAVAHTLQLLSTLCSLVDLEYIQGVSFLIGVFWNVWEQARIQYMIILVFGILVFGSQTCLEALHLFAEFIFSRFRNKHIGDHFTHTVPAPLLTAH